MPRCVEVLFEGIINHLVQFFTALDLHSIKLFRPPPATLNNRQNINKVGAELVSNNIRSIWDYKLSGITNSPIMTKTWVLYQMINH